MADETGVVSVVQISCGSSHSCALLGELVPSLQQMLCCSLDLCAAFVRLGPALSRHGQQSHAQVQIMLLQVSDCEMHVCRVA